MCSVISRSTITSRSRALVPSISLRESVILVRIAATSSRVLAMSSYWK